MTEAAIAAFVIVALALLGVAMELEYQPSAPSYAALSGSASTVTFSVRCESRGIIGQSDIPPSAKHRLETEG